MARGAVRSPASRNGRHDHRIPPPGVPFRVLAWVCRPVSAWREARRHSAAGSVRPRMDHSPMRPSGRAAQTALKCSAPSARQTRCAQCVAWRLLSKRTSRSDLLSGAVATVERAKARSRRADTQVGSRRLGRAVAALAASTHVARGRACR